MGIAWADFDADGDLDLACGNSGPDNQVYENTGGTLDGSAIWSSVESDTTYSIAWGDGIYKSVDAGESWTHMGLTETGRIARILVHPIDPNIVFACALGRVTGAPERDQVQDWVIHREVAGWLPDELSVRVECRKIWTQLTDAEQEALLGDLTEAEGAANQAHASLLQRYILQETPEGVRFFSQLFGEYVQRLRATRRPKLQGVRIDVESGAVTTHVQDWIVSPKSAASGS